MPEPEVVDAVKKVVGTSPERKFRESLELAVNLKDIDLSVQSNRIEMDIRLPRGRGKNVGVGIFASGELAEKAKGKADTVITPEMLTELIGDRRRMKSLARRTSFFLAEVSMMPTIGRSLGQILGPRGKMPRPIPPTADPAPLIAALKSSVRVRTRDRMTFHVPVGTRDMAPEHVAENIEEVLARVTSKLVRGPQNIRSVYLKSTMGTRVPVPLPG